MYLYMYVHIDICIYRYRHISNLAESLSEFDMDAEFGARCCSSSCSCISCCALN